MKTILKILFLLLPLIGCSQANLGTGFFGKIRIGTTKVPPTERLRVDGTSLFTGLASFTSGITVSGTVAFPSTTSIGSVTNTEISYLDGVTSNIQTQLNSTQNQLSGTGFVKASGTTISYDNSTYLTTSAASSTYLTTSTAASIYAPIVDATFIGATIVNDLYVNSFKLNFGASLNGKILTSDSDGVGTWQLNKAVTGLGYASGSFYWDENGASYGTPALLTESAASSTYMPFSGGTLTGPLNLQHSVRVGGTSAFGGNVFLGKDALVGRTTASNNTAIGSSASMSVTTGDGNTAVGQEAYSLATTGSYNTSVGIYSMSSPVTGQYNVANGNSALANLTSGSRNTAIGNYAGQYNSTGSNNTYIGGFTGTGYANRSNRVWLSDGLGNVKIMGDSLGNIGIGGLSASSKLHIRAIPYSISQSNGITLSTEGNEIFGSINITTNSAGSPRFSIKPPALGGTGEALSILDNGNIGIGTIEPTSKLQVVGLPVYTDNTTATAGGLTAGAFYRTAVGVLMVVF